MVQVSAGDQFLDLVAQERERQVAQGKSDSNSLLGWHLIVSDQLALLTRQISLARYTGLATLDTETEPLEVHSKEERKAIQLGLVRLAATASAWHEAIEQSLDEE